MRNTTFSIFFILSSIIGFAQLTITFKDGEDDNVVSGILVRDNLGVISGPSDSLGVLKLVSSEFDSLLVIHPYMFPFWVNPGHIENGIVNLKENVQDLPELRITPSRPLLIDGANLFHSFSTTQEQIIKSSPDNSADLLDRTGKVYVQKSQFGGGSPVIRGFEANRILLMVDGIRMNNAIYRGGHLQNIITIDPNILEEVEVFFGPGDVSYGSDALGGVIHLKTLDPELGTDSTLTGWGRFAFNYNSASNGLQSHGHFNVGGKRWAGLTSFSYSNFGDLKSGQRQNVASDTLWLRSQYAGRVLGKDTMFVNEDPLKQIGTNYTQTDLLQKIIFVPNRKLKHVFNIQYSTSPRIPRYDRLALYSGDLLKHAEWNYEPQNRLMLSYSTEIIGENKLYDRAELRLSFQTVLESRVTRGFNSVERTVRAERVNVYGIIAAFNKTLKSKHLIEYGLESYSNTVNSTALTQDIETFEILNESTRYPDGGSFWNTTGGYLKHCWRLKPRHHLTSGARINLVNLSARFEDTTFFPLPFSDIKESNMAITAQSGLNSYWSKGLSTLVLFSSGFRSPNIDDVGKVFDSNPGNVIIPNDNLKPEYTYNVELDVNKKVKQFFQFNAGVYYTLIRNLIKVKDYNLDGKEFIMYDGSLSKVQANTNSGKGHLYGFFTDIEMRLYQWNLNGSINYTKGWDVSDNIPLAHVTPVYWIAGLDYEKEAFKLNLSFRGNFKKLASEFHPGGTDKLIYATPEGIPSWWIMNFNSHYQLSSKWLFILKVHNLLDIHYRTFSSGINAPGRNWQIGISMAVK